MPGIFSGNILISLAVIITGICDGDTIASCMIRRVWLTKHKQSKNAVTKARVVDLPPCSSNERITNVNVNKTPEIIICFVTTGLTYPGLSRPLLESQD